MNAKKVKEATREIRLDYGGETLLMQYRFAQYAPDGISTEQIEKDKRERQANAKERKLLRAVLGAQDVYDNVSDPFDSEGKMRPVILSQVDEAEAALQEAENAYQQFKAKRISAENTRIAEETVKALADWDMTYEDGTPMPIDAEIIAKEVPYRMLLAMWARINEVGNDVDPPKPAPLPST